MNTETYTADKAGKPTRFSHSLRPTLSRPAARPQSRTARPAWRAQEVRMSREETRRIVLEMIG